MRRLSLFALSVAFALAAAGCGAHAGHPGPAGAAGLGTVVGRIDACDALGVAKPRYVGGTVVALRGAIRVAMQGPTWGKVVLPTDAVARQRVPVGGYFHFSLPPGHYVIDLPHYAGSNGGSWLVVTVREAVTAHADLPDLCR